MGFYAPAQIVKDAQKHGVTLRPVDINHSAWDHALEEKGGNYCALHLGLRQVLWEINSLADQHIPL